MNPILLAVLAFLESSGDSTAVNGKAVGLYQITPILVQDVNRFAGTSYTPDDRYDPVKSAEMVVLYVKHYLSDNPSVGEAAALWRCGPTGMKNPTPALTPFRNCQLAANDPRN